MPPTLTFLAAAPVAAFFAALLMSRLIARWSLGRSFWGKLGGCAICGAKLPWRLLVPALFLVGGNAPLPCRHRQPRGGLFNVVLLTAVSTALVSLYLGRPWQEPIQAMLLLFLLYPLAIIDITGTVVEMRLVIAGLVLRFPAVVLYQEQQVLSMITGMLMGAGLFAMVEAIYRTLRGRPGLGQGDAAVMGLIGAFVGWEGVLPVVALAAVTGLVIGFPALVIARRSLATPIPFVPFLALAGFAVFLAQEVWEAEWRGLVLSIGPGLLQ